MDLTNTVLANSDQLDASDLPQPRTFTVDRVEPGPSKEQPVNVYLREYDRPWRPSKTVRRILVAAWGADGSQYAGKRLTLFNDPTVMFGGIACGGVRVSHMSDLDEPLKIALLVKRGKSALHTVQPLRETTPPHAAQSRPPIIPEDVLSCTSEDELRAMWQGASDDIKALINQRVAELRATAVGIGA